MSFRRLLFPALCVLLISAGSLLGQTPAPPATPEAPRAPRDLMTLFGSGSFLGIYTEDVTRENMGRYGLSQPRGVAVLSVVEGSPAEKAGLRKDDVIVRFNGEEVTSVRKLNRLISEVAPDHTARLTITRGGGEQELSATLGERKGFSAARVYGWPQDGDSKKLLEEMYRAPGAPRAYTLALGSSRRIGVSSNTLTDQLADYFGISGGKGVLVSSVKEGSPAARAGIKAGDVITEVDGERIEDVNDLTRAINKKSEGDVTLTITRDRSQRTVRVTPEKSQLMPDFGPGFRFETPRVGQLTLPRLESLPRLQALPGVRLL